jgi:hypothetical protein
MRSAQEGGRQIAIGAGIIALLLLAILTIDFVLILCVAGLLRLWVLAVTLFTVTSLAVGTGWTVRSFRRVSGAERKRAVLSASPSRTAARG